MSSSPSDSPVGAAVDEPLFTDEDAALVKAVLNSRVWRLLCDSLVAEREALFSGRSNVAGLAGHPSTTEALWKAHGAILLIQHLLQEAPRNVVWWRHYMDEQKSQRRTKSRRPKSPEREYRPDPDLNTPTEFDIPE
jgi:hypothetical protein